jgi:hypothetical protein
LGSPSSSGSRPPERIPWNVRAEASGVGVAKTSARQAAAEHEIDGAEDAERGP